MEKEKTSDMYTDWYNIWMKQNKDFFDTAEKNLKGLFNEPMLNPTEHLRQMNAWLDILKNQWQLIQLSEEQKKYANYWQSMMKMCMDASDMLAQRWLKRAEEKNPVKNAQELFELWLACCHEAYQKEVRSKQYQDPYSALMNETFKFWEKALHKK